MIVSRIIAQSSLRFSEPKYSSLKHQPLENPLCCEIIQAILYDSLFTPDDVKREFVTQFVEHYSWFPPAARNDDLAREVQTYQMEALKSVLDTRSSRSATPTSAPLKEVVALKSNFSKIRRASTDNEFLGWLIQQREQLASPNQRDTIIYVEGGRYLPSFGSSSVSSYLRTSLSSHHIYLNALNGNPTIARSLASRSSRSSQVSGSSSLQRFKAAALSRKDQPASTPGPGLHDLIRHWEDEELSWDDYFQALGSSDFRRGLKSTMPTLVEEEEGKSTIRGRIGRLLKGKGKADAVGLE
jgi:hypothetical protein